MRLSESVVDTNRFRLSGRTDTVGKRTGLGIVGGFLFGLLFVAVGTSITLVGMKVIPVTRSSVNTPYWVLSCVGASFALIGLFFWGMVFQEWRLVRWRKSLAVGQPYLEVLADHHWDISGVTKSSWGEVWKALLRTFFFAVFLVPFNWWAWISHNSVRVMTSLEAFS